MINSLRSVKKALATWLRQITGKSDFKRWSDPDSLWSEWDERNQLIASLVSEGDTVIEFGAGKMKMKEFLPNGCLYTPSDIVDRGAGTLVCNLNDAKLPEFPVHDIAIFSGVIEYVNDVPKLIDHLAKTVNIFLISYVSKESCPKMIERLEHGWVNNFSSQELEEIFISAGYSLETTLNWNTQTILKFVKVTTT